METKRYLGDSIYIDVDDSIPGQFVLTTEDGITVSNTIYINHQIVKEVIQYLADLDAEADKAIRKAMLNREEAMWNDGELPCHCCHRVGAHLPGCPELDM